MATVRYVDQHVLDDANARHRQAWIRTTDAYATLTGEFDYSYFPKIFVQFNGKVLSKHNDRSATRASLLSTDFSFPEQFQYRLTFLFVIR